MRVMPKWSTACLDWEDRIVKRQSLVPFDPLFADEAEAALQIYRELQLVDVPGRPTIGEACLPWAFDLPRALFGSYDASTGRRLIRYFFEFVAKKNSKSTRAAGIMVTALMRNWRDSGEFYILAPTREIADNSFFPARDMVLSNENLRALLHVQQNHRMITHRNTGAFLKVVAADAETVGGKKTIGLLVDELWQFGHRANAEAMIREAQGGLASRPEGFVIYLSTQADDAPAGIFAQKLNDFRAIRDGEIIDPSSLPILYEFPEALIASAAYKKPENFYIPNPNLGKSVDLQYLVEQQIEAERNGPASVVNFEAKHLNVQAELVQGVEPWSGADVWVRQGDKALTLEALIARSEVAVVGIDGGGRDDLLGVVVIGREKGTRRWLLWAHAFAHSVVLERRKELAPLLFDFEKEGSLTFSDKGTANIKRLAEIVKKVSAAGLLPEKDAVGYDPNNAGIILEELDECGITDEQRRRLLQGPALAPALYGLDLKLDDDTLTHDGSAMMNWVVGNVRIEKTARGPMATKRAAGTAKIDPFIAAEQATILMSWNPAARGLGIDQYIAALAGAA